MRRLLTLATVIGTLVMLPRQGARAEHPFSPESCGGEVMDLAGIIACRRLLEAGRTERCARTRGVDVRPPTDGARVIGFGDKTQYGSTSKGVVFGAGGGSVLAPSGGHVLFAGNFRSYGRLVIIDACSVDVLVAGIGEIGVAPRALVEAGQPIGRATDPGGVIYVEVRQGDRPVDPFAIKPE